MQKQFNKINLAGLLLTRSYKQGSRLLTRLLVLLSTISLCASPIKAAEDTKHPGFLLSTVTTDPSNLFFSAIQSQSSDKKQVKAVISGVSSTAQTTITVPDFYETFSTSGAPVKTFTVTGNVSVIFSVRFTGSADPGIFAGDLKITGSEINTTIVSLSTAVSPNPSITPSALNFSTINDGKPSLRTELNLTISAVPAGAKTFIRAPDLYQLFISPTENPGSFPGNSVVITGGGSFKLFVGFTGSVNPGTFSGVIVVEGDAIFSKTVPVKTIVTVTPTPSVNPGSLSGFTAIQGVSASMAQSFDLSVKGLPFIGNPVITVTAPTGYQVGLSANASSFVNAFVVSANNGVINTKVFVRLKNTNPVGPVNGTVSITGSQVNPLAVSVTGTISPKPIPTLTVDKGSLTGFTTTTNRSSVAQSYSLKATNLDPGINATVKSPAGYEISLTNVSSSVFSSQLTINQLAGSINATVFARLKSQATAGTITGTIQNLVAGLSKNVAVSGTVVLPPVINVNPTGITGFQAVQNQASASKTYTVSASNLAAGLSATVTAPTNYEVRLQGTGSFSSTLTLTQSSTGTISRIVEVRLKATTTIGTITGTIRNTVAGLVRNVGVTGTVAAPTLSTSITSLSLTAFKNQASAAKSYKVIATNLAVGITATLTAPGTFEISKDSIVFAGSLALSQNLTNGINVKVFVRLKASAVTGNITGSIQHTVAGLTKSVSLGATVIAPTLSVNPISLTGFNASLNQASATKTYNLVATNLAAGINPAVTAPAGYEISVQGTPGFSTSLALAQTSTGVVNSVLLVRLKAQATIGSITGNITNSVAGLSKTVALSGTITAPIPLAGNSAAQIEKLRKSLLGEEELFINTFPNPVTDQFTMEFLAPENDPVQIRLLSAHGKVLLIRKEAPGMGIRQIILSLAGQPAGSYFVEMLSGSKRKTVQILKQ